MASLRDLLKKVGIIQTPKDVPVQTVRNFDSLNDEQKKQIRNFGVTLAELQDLLYKHTLINFERHSLYREIDRAITHPLMGAAMELYADYVTVYSSLHGATVWIKAENKTYEKELNKMLDRIGIEERVFDWAWTAAAFGDLFVEVEGDPGLGVTNVIDDEHPLNMSRVDYNGRLIGFYRSPMGAAMQTPTQIQSPWKYVHFRLLGAKKKRPIFTDPMYSEYRTINLMSPETRRVTSKYGTSLMTNALPVYKRLRMAEDSLMLARLSKGITRYIYKVMVDGTNLEAVSEIIDEYKTLLKKARAVNPNNGNEAFDEKYNPLGVNEDVILPVWGDVNNLAVEELGGKVDIRWIVDIDELRNQLASALRVPLQLLGGYQGEVPSNMGSSSLENLDIRFARSSRRLQRTVMDGIKRLCMIHLAYMGMDPDPSLFEVCMAETSSAEEEDLKNALDKGVDVVDKMMDLIDKVAGQQSLDRVELFNYLSAKVLKIEDFNIWDYIKNPTNESKEALPSTEQIKDAVTTVLKEKTKLHEKFKMAPEGKEYYNSDLISFLPLKEGSGKFSVYTQENWEKNYKDVKITETIQKTENLRG